MCVCVCVCVCVCLCVGLFTYGCFAYRIAAKRNFSEGILYFISMHIKRKRKLAGRNIKTAILSCRWLF